MAYRFKSGDASTTEALRRIAAEEFAAIGSALADKSVPLPRKVHEGRKATKRLRALLRLVAPVFPEAREEIAVLRDAAARLSALRDKGALAETLARLDLPEDVSANLGAALNKRRAAGTAAQKRLLGTFAGEMAAAAGRAQSWTLTQTGWHALAPGLQRSHRRFRKSFEAARRARDEEPVHEFRKRAKDHWYQTLLLRGAFPEVMDGYAAAAERLCDDLGDWRDLGLLEAALIDVPVHLLAKPDAATALALIAKARRRALRRALGTSRRLAGEKPRAYTARLAAWSKTRG
ncbi:CHAD domain-containing protein [Hyphomonas sp.]|uniref:CHAD domain-containing protein n=1 Tax=Hyphomonas sp. TaxID=87 RepID=UPI0025C0CF7F|nr:CHAD domain-containing protein [Hyphomonas sp.]